MCRTLLFTIRSECLLLSVSVSFVTNHFSDSHQFLLSNSHEFVPSADDIPNLDHFVDVNSFSAVSIHLGDPTETNGASLAMAETATTSVALQLGDVGTDVLSMTLRPVIIVAMAQAENKVGFQR